LSVFSACGSTRSAIANCTTARARATGSR
jgi:hypothetical protein